MKKSWYVQFCVAATIGALAVSADAVVNIQNIGAGARSRALGNSFVALADNGDAVFANPAGVAQLQHREVAYTNVSLLFEGIDGDDLGQHVASYVQPLGSRLGVGIGFERIGSALLSAARLGSAPFGSAHPEGNTIASPTPSHRRGHKIT